MNVLQQFVFWLDKYSTILERVETKRADWFEHRFNLETWFPRGTRILDIGPGVGDITKRLRTYSKNPVYAVDIVDYRRLGNKDGSFELILGDGKRLPFKDRVFDRVSLFWVLHHEKDTEQLLKEARRVLDDNGEMIIIEDTLNNHSKLNQLLLKIYDRVINLDLDHHPHSNRSLEDWKRMIEDRLSMSIIEVQTIEWFTPFKLLQFGVLRCKRA